MTKYTSLFKINGIPILPPLMTPEKLIEYQKYKAEAIAIENNRKVNNSVVALYDSESDDLYKESTDISEKCVSIGSRVEMKFLEKSETLIYDVMCNTVMIPNDKFYNSDLTFSKTSQVNCLLPQSNDEVKCMDLRLLPTIVVNSPKKSIKEDFENILNNTDVAENLIDSPVTCQKVVPLIRSNSFTLERPSEALANELMRRGSELLKQKIKKKTLEIELKNKSMTKKIEENHHISERRKKSPYDSKLIIKNKCLKKHKNTGLKSNKSLQKKILQESERCGDEEFLKSEQIKKMLQQFENERKLKLKELFNKQKEEQEKIEEIFQNQEKLLLELFKNCANIKHLDLKEDQYCKKDLNYILN